MSSEVAWRSVGESEPLWRAELGFGHSSFAVVDGRVFTMGYDLERGRDVVHCLDAESGAELWRHEYEAEYWNEGHDGGTCTTPTVVGDVVFTSNREGSVFAFDAKSGGVRWQRQLAREHEVSPPQWGFSGSPFPVSSAEGDLLILNVGRLIALDQKSGVTRWLTERHYGNAYSTPSVFDYRDAASILALNGEGLAVVDLADGSELAFHPFARSPLHANLGATPIDVDGRIFLSGQPGGGCVLLEPTEEGLAEIWASRSMRTTHSGCVRYGNAIYGFDQSVLMCIDLDGKVRWKQRGIGLGALSIAGGRLIVVGARGELIVAEATPEEYRELSRTEVLEDGAFWSTPVLCNGLIYVRNSLGSMVCLDHRGDASGEEIGSSLPAESPTVEAVLARHLEAVGGREALSSLRSAHFQGAGEQHMGGPIDRSDAELFWATGGWFKLRFTSGFEFGVTPEEGWSVTQHGPSMLPPQSRTDLLEAIDFHRWLDERWGFDSVAPAPPKLFDDRACFVVQATRADGAARTLYFETTTGLLAGMEGADTPLWTFGDYREHEGLTLPRSVSFFWPDSGAMTHAAFDVLSLNDVQPASFEPPEIIVMINRSSAEKAEAERLLRAEYGDLVGHYRIATGNMAGTAIDIMIQDGALQYSWGGPYGSYMTEPDASDRMYDWCNRDLSFQIDRDESGARTGLRFFVQDAESGVLEPRED